MLILLFSVLNDEQRALVERIFHEHHIHFQRISFNIVKSEEAAEDVVSTAFIKIMDNIRSVLIKKYLESIENTNFIDRRPRKQVEKGHYLKR